MSGASCEGGVWAEECMWAFKRAQVCIVVSSVAEIGGGGLQGCMKSRGIWEWV